jgi:UDP-3-O-[3-hydroxymyristoyl] N-acetylglucosamine deacetylase
MNHIGMPDRLSDSGVNAKVARQRTLRKSIGCLGVGLHSGAKVSMTLRPGDVDEGIVFRRVDLDGAEVPARWDHVVDTTMCTSIGRPDGVRISTIEHLMAAFAGCGVDNAVVEVDGAEVPIMDGSAQPFVFLIECAGVVEQNAERRAVRILKPVRIEDGDRVAELMPSDDFTVEFEIDFDRPAIARQSLEVTLANGAFKTDIARARTFGFEDEVERLQAAGLALGGSLHNAVVVSGDRVLNKGGLRFDDEFVRHKVLDAIGDLYLAGGPIIGRYRGVRAGHSLTRQVLRKLFDDAEAWQGTSAPAGGMAIETIEPTSWETPAPVAATA